MQLIKTRTGINDRETYMNGRIEAHHVPDIVKSRDERSFIAKIPAITSRAANSEYLLKKEEFVGDIIDWMQKEKQQRFTRAGAIIDSRQMYLCCCPEGTIYN